MTSALAYSLKSSGQLSMSIIRSHTNWRGALMTTALSVCAATALHLLLGEPAVHVLDRLADGVDAPRVLVGDGEAVLLLHRELDLDEGQRVQSHVLEAGVVVLDDVRFGQPHPVDEDVLEVRESERLSHQAAPFSGGPADPNGTARGRSISWVGRARRAPGARPARP